GAVFMDQPAACGAIEHADGGAVRLLCGGGGRGGAHPLDRGAQRRTLRAVVDGMRAALPHRLLGGLDPRHDQPLLMRRAGEAVSDGPARPYDVDPGRGPSLSLAVTDLGRAISSSLLIWAPVLLFSIVAHEYAHAAAAYRQGDNTAYMLGR